MTGEWLEMPSGRLRDGRLKVGRRVLEFSVLVPNIKDIKGTIVEAPGMTAKRRCYRALSDAYAERGWASISLAHLDASGCYSEEIAAALDEVHADGKLPHYGDTGSFEGRNQCHTGPS